MKLSQKLLLVATTVTAILTVGCGQHSKTDDVAQNTQQTTPAPAGSGAGGTGNTTVGVIDDSVITTKVKAAIVAEPTLSALDIKVKTTDGVVTLSGTIDTPDKADRAKQLAQTVDGVKMINNELVVKSSS